MTPVYSPFNLLLPQPLPLSKRLEDGCECEGKSLLQDETGHSRQDEGLSLKLRALGRSLTVFEFSLGYSGWSPS
jgi:hypothetical protein